MTGLLNGRLTLTDPAGGNLSIEARNYDVSPLGGALLAALAALAGGVMGGMGGLTLATDLKPPAPPAGGTHGH